MVSPDCPESVRLKGMFCSWVDWKAEGDAVEEGYKEPGY